MRNILEPILSDHIVADIHIFLNLCIASNSYILKSMINQVMLDYTINYMQIWKLSIMF